MSFNVSHVIFLLLQKYAVPIPNNPTISREERKLAAHVINLIEQATTGYFEIEESEELENEEDGDWEPEEFKPFDDFVLPSHQEVQFGDRFVSRSDMQDAIDYYRGTKKGSRPLSSMTANFRWITSENHLQKLRKFEKEQDDFKESRTNMLKVLGNRLYEVVKEKLDNGVALHDSCLTTIAQDLNRKETKVDSFVAIQTWITKWKKSHRIVSRKVTKFTTRKCMINKEAIQKTADDFVQNARREMSLFAPSMIFNSDQTGIQKELYSARSLAWLGEKVVERLVQAKSSLTHSFTFLPMIFMDGTLGPKAYMVLSEPTGHFPPSKPIPNVKNLVVRCGKSHIMTKELMRDWLRTCVFDPSVSKRLYMLVDSWPSFKDHRAIKECAPPGYDVTIRNIPPHCTSLIQPLDLYWNGPWKNLLRKFTSYVLNFHPDFLIAQRNNEIMMISLLYHQISAHYFQPFLQYCWKKAGYTDVSSPFLTPTQFCFGEVKNEDCKKRGCTSLAFIKCARCGDCLCFDHFILKEQHFCRYH
ncbi:hypothetical protein CAEBREN_20315 [Caenorhabditis brenneri]|uniref:HTH CENPB-type domain-containing protein n=1 Tax=Caenorhabditis brenneri TaxID=135651 RepID=G0PGL2_CAEBE|nr:hypothetical protein CAEBREN_20315 [Caenorhabditis brenneri]